MNHTFPIGILEFIWLIWHNISSGYLAIIHLNFDLTYYLKFIYFEKATKICKISTLLLSYVVPVKSKVDISQNFVAFSENMNFTYFDKRDRIADSWSASS